MLRCRTNLSLSSELILKQINNSLHRLKEMDDDIWGKICYVEKGVVVSSAYVMDTKVKINNSDIRYNGQVFGLNYNLPDNDSHDETAAVRRQIGEGLEITKDSRDNILIRKMSDIQVVLMDHDNTKMRCIGQELLNKRGQIQNEFLKVFDFATYKKLVKRETQQEKKDFERLLLASTIRLAFVPKDSDVTTSTCYLFVCNFPAVNMLLKKSGVQTLLKNSPKFLTQNDRRKRLDESVA